MKTASRAYGMLFLMGTTSAAQTINVKFIKEKYGQDFYQRIDSKGGKKSKRHLTTEEASALGKRGGRPVGWKPGMSYKRVNI